MPLLQDILRRSADLTAAWGNQPLGGAASLRELLTVDGLSLWDVIAVDLALYYLPPLLAGRTSRRARWRRGVRRRWQWARRCVRDAMLPLVADDQTPGGPAGPAALLLGFNDYIYRDVLAPVADVLPHGLPLQPVALRDDGPPATGSGVADRRTNLWEYWTPACRRQARALQHEFRRRAACWLDRAEVQQLAHDLPAVAAADLRETLRFLCQVHVPRLLRYAAVAGSLYARHPPRVVVSPDMADPRNRVFVWLAHAAGIPTLDVQFGLYNATESVEWRFLLADRVAAWGESSRRILEQHGVAHDKITLTGSPRYDALAVTMPGAVAAQRQAWEARPGEVVVLLASSYAASAYDDLIDPAFVREIKRAIFTAAAQTPGLLLVCKPHPLEKIKELHPLAPAGARVVWAAPKDDIGAMIKAADVFVTFGTTATMDALILNKLVIWPYFHGLRWFHDDFLDSGAVMVAHSADELRNAFQAVARQQTAERLSAMEPARREFLANWVFRTDGAAARRVADLASALAGGETATMGQLAMSET